MKKTKKSLASHELESLKLSTFNQVLGGDNTPPPGPSNQTGELRDIVVDGKVIGQYYSPEVPKNIGVGL